MTINFDSSEAPILTQNSPRQKPPKQILAQDQIRVFSFAPNRDTLGGTAYLLCEQINPEQVNPEQVNPEQINREQVNREQINILVDCPAWDAATQEFLQAQGGVHWLFITHRAAIGKVREIQQTFNCAIAIQEQEAYLLPGLTTTPFHHELLLTANTRALWTPGHSPGSACLYHAGGGGILFSGRHLLPTPQGEIRPIQTPTTFHWRRQQTSLQHLQQTFSSETLQYLCPGANIGFLRGKTIVEHAYNQLFP
jgi:glyoxylase-like metal-dependent hydrolase (beta-lactamase superfamily II)